MSQKEGRLAILDVYRGFAVFGIFFVNITIMHSVMIFQDSYLTQFDDTLSLVTAKLLQLFFYNKFFPIFSFLFGLGLSIQMDAKRRNNQAYEAFFIRRMAILFLFGVVHILLLWSGDVLHLYALIGLLCIVIIKLTSKWLIGLSLGLLVYPFWDNALIWFSSLFEKPLEHDMVALGSSGVADIMISGRFTDLIHLHWIDYQASLPLVLFYLGPMAFAMFMLGIVAGRQTVRIGSEEWVAQYRNSALLILVLTTVYRLSFLWLLPETDLYRDALLRPIWFKLMYLSDIAFGLWYLWFIAWAWHFTGAKRLLHSFSYVGRMALTNYMSHSVIGLIIFSNIGLASYQTLHPAECFGLAFISFSIQLVISRWWLTYFAYGPLEWLWRCGSYLKWFPIKKGRA